MLLALKPHPDFLFTATSKVEVDIKRLPQNFLQLVYSVHGKTADLHIQPPARPDRKDELWRRTCFEMFVQAKTAPRYYEFNFSPSSEWAAYTFSNYREGMAAANVQTPTISLHITPELFQQTVMVRLPDDCSQTFALTAVLEEKNGERSFWALHHPPGKPDFHHSSAFCCTLAEAA